jgi:hypothetical protein
MRTFEYRKVTKFYTIWWICAVILISFLITTFLDVAAKPSTVYAIFIGIVITQFFIAEFRAKYWPVTLSDSGISFHSKSSIAKLDWSDIESIQSFPTKEYQPTEWHQSMYSSGIMIKSVNGDYLAIYSKIKNFKTLENAINQNT